MKELLRKLTWIFQRRRKEQELRDELAFHLAEEAEGRDLIAARRELGNLGLVMEDTRSTWSWTLLEQLAQDLRYAVRTMASNKTFSGLAILSLALGIGANTAIFSFMDSILLRSLPVDRPEALVILKWHTHDAEFHGSDYHESGFYDPHAGFTQGAFAYPAFEMFRRQDRLFTTVFGYQGTGKLNLSVRGRAELAIGEYVSGDYFRGLGVPPAAGRLLGSDDDRAGAPGVAVLSYAFADRLMGGAASAPGQSILLNNQPFTVVGVAPPGFFGADPGAAPEFYVPMHAGVALQAGMPYGLTAKTYLDPNNEWVEVMARLRSGVTLPQVRAALEPQFRRYMVDVNTARNRADLPTLLVMPGAGGLDGLRHEFSQPLMILMTLVGLVLAIACANIANLLLARSASRTREMALRLSMGADRRRIIRQLLTESVLLAACGGALGLAFAIWGIRFLKSLLETGDASLIPRADLNWHVLAAAALLALATGVVFGLAPAIRSTRVDLISALKQSKTDDLRGRSFAGVSMSRLLVVFQMSVTLLLLVGAGLFLRTLSNLQAIDVGFNREHVLTFGLNARQAGHHDPEIATLYDELRRQFARAPGVRGASLSDLPLIGRGRSMTMVKPEGRELQGSLILHVGEDFFSTMQVPILLGRAIDGRDRQSSQRVAIVNQVFAKANFGDRNPVGQRLAIPEECPKCDIEIAGVAANARYGRLRGEVEPTVFLPLTQPIWGPVGDVMYELRTAGNPLDYIGTVREIVRRADPRIPPSDIATQSALIDQTISRQVVFARLSLAFAILALAIAAVGLYGTVSYRMARRTGEIGIRMALGARGSSVVWMVLREVLGLTAAGLAISIPAVFAASRLVESFLFGVRHDDPAALIVAVVTLLLAALIAGFVPARKASQIDPAVTLRAE
jgi:macrolide transport system ATP-binding/permease protein